MMSQNTMSVVAPDTVSTTDATREAGLTYRQVSYWIAMKAVTPAFGNGGSGFPYRFTRRQVEHLTQIGDLYRRLDRDVGGGPTTEFIKRVWKALESDGEFRLDDGPVAITLPWPPHTMLPESA